MTDYKICEFPPCDKGQHAKGLCRRHYLQQSKGKTLFMERAVIKTCQFSTCEKPHLAKGLCARHYGQKKRGEELWMDGPQRVYQKTCEFDGCERKQYSKMGYCNTHYMQIRNSRPLTEVREQKGSRLDRDDEGRKWCSWCKTWQPESSFAKHSKSPDKLQSVCRECRTRINRVKRFGLSPEQYDQMLDKQGGGCAICKAPVSGQRRLHVDHDHSCCPGYKTCGKCVRGILCGSCNTALGSFKDSIEFLKAAISYLELER